MYRHCDPSTCINVPAHGYQCKIAFSDLCALEDSKLKLIRKLLVLCVVVCLGSSTVDRAVCADTPDSDMATSVPHAKMIWTDRGTLTPAQVYFGVASEHSDPLSRLPVPPFSNFQQDEKPGKLNPKCYVTDAKGVVWTAKFGIEVHPDVAAPRLAWALGFGVDETYYVPGGTIEGVTSKTKRGKESKFVSADGTFMEARFKRHPEHHPEGRQRRRCLLG